MSIYEHPHSVESQNQAKNGVFVTGMSLVKCCLVNARFTHKELTLVIGIIVALIVAATLWMNRANSPQVLKKSDVVSTQTTGEVAKSVLRMRIF
jgi:hypothetical protein